MSYLDSFAPYPRTEDDATADALARHAAAFAQGRNAVIGDLLGNDREADRREYKIQVGLFVSEYAIARLLRALIEHAPESADEVARDLWGDWEDGGVMPELLWEWLTEYGVPPCEVADAAREAWQKRKSAEDKGGAS